MNEFERRVIDLALNHQNLMKAAGVGFGGGARVEPYVYAGAVGSVAAPLVAGVTSQIVIPVQADSYFLLSYISAAQVLNASTFMVPSAGEIQITDTGNGVTIYNRPQPASVVAGTCDFNSPGLPFLLTVPRVILPNVNIKVDYTHRGLNSDGFQIAFFGAKVYTN
jgi:hypothetical protein